jgi:DNA processing protein
VLADDSRLREAAALVALVRYGRPTTAHYADLVEEAGSAEVILEQEAGLLAGSLVDASAADLRVWSKRGIRVITVLDQAYPENLRAVWDRPALMFSIGEVTPRDDRAVAVIGSRRASDAGVRRAVEISDALIGAGYTIVSGLATGIDTAAHTTALERGARTVAVLGNGVLHSYPPQNARLQRQIADQGALISQFWPDEKPSRLTFPMRNAVMSGLALATVIVEAGPTSGARTQARRALAHGRPVLLLDSVLDQPWAQELAGRPGTYAVGSGEEVPEVVDRISSLEVPLA